MWQPVPVARRVATALFLWPALALGQQVPTLTLTHDLRIDAAAQDLSPIGWLVVARNGTIIASQPQDSRVAFFDAGGASLGTFGRNGEGPGEFRHPNPAGWLGDTLWVGDPSTRRVTLISPDRELLRTIPWVTSITFDTALATPPQFFWVLPRALYADGSFLVDAMLAQDSPPMPSLGPAQQGRPFVRIASNGRFRRIAVSVPEGDCQVAYRSATVSGVFTIPFCASPLYDLATDGGRFAIATAENAGERDAAYRVTIVRERGDTAFNRTFRGTPVPIPRRILDSVLTRSQRPGPNRSPEELAAWRTVKLPSTFPPLNRILLGRDESTWIEHYAFRGERTWTVLGATGTPIGRIVLPRNVRVEQASRDFIWATETDEDGLQHIVRYRVTGARGP